MSVKWNNYPEEKRQIKLKYLEFLKLNSENIRNLVTEWALKEYPYLNIPEIQFGGSFDHGTLGFFFKDHGFSVTKAAFNKDVMKSGMTRNQYIDFLIELVRFDKRI